MPQYLLAGDIGGTRSLLELYESRGAAMRPVHEHSFRSQAFASFDALLDDFFRLEPVMAFVRRVARGDRLQGLG